MKRKLLSILALLIFISTESWGQRFAPPGGGGGGGLGEVTISLSPTSLTMTVGESNTVTCTISGMAIGYTSWSVTEGDGNIEIIATGNTCTVQAYRVGTATIQATFSGKTATCTVTVNPLTVAANEGAAGEYWATYYNETVGFTADANTTVFKAALAGDQLTLTEVANREIPYGQAVILKSSASSITLTYDELYGTLSGNQLVGTTAAITNPGNAYVLNKKNGVVGFYKLSASGTIGANKAYLTYTPSASAPAREFFGFSETTGIEMPKAEVVETDAEVYDLQGRKVAQPTKGLYIVNGKKIVLK